MKRGDFYLLSFFILGSCGLIFANHSSKPTTKICSKEPIHLMEQKDFIFSTCTKKVDWSLEKFAEGIQKTSPFTKKKKEDCDLG